MNMTVPDTEGLECWNCQAKTPLEDEEMHRLWIVELRDSDLENMYYKEGEKEPK